MMSIYLFDLYLLCSSVGSILVLADCVKIGVMPVRRLVGHVVPIKPIRCVMPLNQISVLVPVVSNNSLMFVSVA